MALGDFQVFNGSAYNAFMNTFQQQIALWNGATRNALVMNSVKFMGDKNELAAFENISALVGNRDPSSAAANASHALLELLKIDVKVGWGMPKITYTNSSFDWTSRDPAQACTLFGEQVAECAMAYMLNSALYAIIGAVDSADVTYDGTAGIASLESLNLGAGKYGDRQAALVSWIMHSKSQTDIYGQALANSNDLFSFGTIRVIEDGHGRPLIITDSDALHFDNAGTENYHQVALVAGGATVMDQADTRAYEVTDIDPVNPVEQLTATGSFGIGIKGYSFNAAVVQPDDAEIALPANYTRVGALKDGAGVVVTTLQGIIMAKQEVKGVKKGDVVIEAKRLVEFLDKQGIKRKDMRPFKVSANAFSSVAWYGVKITGGVAYYVEKALELGAEKAQLIAK